jgi:DHA2 family multidrug resistance protein-like MFS transporter
LLPALAVGLGGLLAVAFARRQRRLPQPMLDLSLFSQRSFSVAIGVLTLGSVVLAGVGFLTAQYLQLVLGLSPLTAGLWTLPPLAAGIAAVVLVQTSGQRLTVAASTAAGLMVAAGGLAVLTQAPTNGIAVVVTGLALLFAGLMPVLAQGVDTVTASAPPDRAGAASALSETTQELGGALGIAALGSLTAAVYRTQISELLQGVPPPIADTARDTLAGALSVASDLPATVLSGCRDRLHRRLAHRQRGRRGRPRGGGRPGRCCPAPTTTTSHPGLHPRGLTAVEVAPPSRSPILDRGAAYTGRR